MKRYESHLQYLTKVLFDKEASIAERDDAAMDLYEYDDPIALDALIKVAKNKDEDFTVLNSCGESIASIWLKTNTFNKDIYNSLSRPAQDGIYYVIKNDRPEWLNLL